MKRSLLIYFSMFAAMSAPLCAQGFQRRATLTGASGDRGKCTIEVVVDGAADVEIRGDSATLRNINGNPPQWRRFECSGVLPRNPVDFRFAGVDGRGRQTLIRDPRQGGAAVVRIEDSDGGSEGYTFDIFWGGGQGAWGGGQRAPIDNRGPIGPPPGSFDRDRDRDGRGYGRNPGVEACEVAVRDRVRRDGYRQIDFARINVDNNPGRHDWVIGSLSAARRDRVEYLDFSCSVNLNTGTIRSVDVRRARR